MNWKTLSGYFMAVAMSAMFAAPALAQNVNPKAEQQLQSWMAKDPRLQADPGLMNNPTYLQNHPNFATWLQEHPNAHQQVEQMGAYDRNHQWHYNKNAPNWAQNHPQSAHNDGDWDDHHQWHDKSWFESNKREWAQQHHPEWFEKWKEHHDHDYDHDHDHH